MKICPKCQKEVKDEARFCSGCRYEFSMQSAPGAVCAACGKTLKPGAKFCGNCGAPVQVSTAVVQEREVPTMPEKDYSVIGSYIHWNVLPGQLAVKIDEKDLAAFGNYVKGVNIQDGVTALLLFEGKVIGQLAAGNYPFKDFGQRTSAEEGGVVNTVLRTLGNLVGAFGGACVNAWNRLTGRGNGGQADALNGSIRISEKVPPVAIVLIRSTEFPLVFSYKGVSTANVRCDVGLHLLCKINNINDFYANLLLDSKMVCYETLSKRLMPLFENGLNLSLAEVSPEQICNNGALQARLLPQFQALIPQIFPFISIEQILRLSAEQGDLENLRRLSEELYVSEQELQHVMRRNEFLNRLQSVKNEQELRELRTGNAHRNDLQDTEREQSLHELRSGNAYDNERQTIVNEQEFRNLQAGYAQHNAMSDLRGEQELTDLRREGTNEVRSARLEADFEASKEKIYEEMEATQDERARFDMLLKAQRQLREAKSADEVASAMQGFAKSGLLREQEMEGLRHQIAKDTKIRDLNDVQALAILTMNNEHALAQQKLDWEMQIGLRKLQDDFERQRLQEDFAFERRDKEEARADARRDKEEAHSDARRTVESEYSDLRREVDARFNDSRRSADAQYNDNRRETDMRMENARRKSQLDLDREEMQNQMDLLRQAQAFRKEREDDEHRREMEEANGVRQHELDLRRQGMQEEQMRLDAEASREKVRLDNEALREKQRLDAENSNIETYSRMTAEQIMAANPDISEAAARALEEKFKNEGALQAEKEMRQKTEEMQRQMTAFLQQQMQEKDKGTQDMREMMMQMMQMNNQQNLQQMQMLRDQATAFAGAGANAQQQLMNAKQQELEHLRADVAANSDRFVDGMKTTINAVGNMGTYIPVQPLCSVPSAPARSKPEAKGPAQKVTCPHCGKAVEDAGAMYCDSCGKALKG